MSEKNQNTRENEPGIISDEHTAALDGFLSGVVGSGSAPTEEKVTEKPIIDDGLEDKPEKVIKEEEPIKVKLESEEETDEEEQSSEQGSESTQENEDSTPLTPLAAFLKTSGVLEDLELDLYEFNKLELEDQVDAYRKAREDKKLKDVNEGVVQTINNYKQSNPEWGRVLDAIERGVSPQEFYALDKAERDISSIKETDLEEDDNLQKEVYSRYLRDVRGMGEEEIKELVDYADSSDLLEDKAKKAHSGLKQHARSLKEQRLQEAEQAAEQARIQNEQIIETVKQTIANTQEILPGKKLTEKEKTEIYDVMMRPVKQLQDGTTVNAINAKRMEDPYKFALIESYLYKLGVYDGDFSKILKAQKKEAYNELKGALKSQDDKSHKGGDPVVQKKSKNDDLTRKSMGAALEQLGFIK